MNKKGQINVIDIIAGLIVAVGGGLIFASYVGIGTIFASLGLLIEAIKYVIINGVK